MIQGQEGKEMAFCSQGCAKGYQKVLQNPFSPGEPAATGNKAPVPSFRSPGSGPAEMSPSQSGPYGLLAEKAVEYGATAAVAISAGDVFVDLRARYKCFIPICRKLGSNLCCPPFSPSVDEALRLRDAYGHALLIQCEGDPAEFTYEATQTGIQLKYYLRVNNIVSAVESLAQKAGYYLAIGFGAGHCKLCGHGIDPEIKCAGVVDGKPLWNRCRYPLRARPAMESVGIDVLKTARKAGLAAAFHGITSPLQEVDTASTFGIVFID
jgi:predicted metal-binding protein